MTQAIHPKALFRLSVLGPLASCEHLPRGELKRLLSKLASQPYAILDSRRVISARRRLRVSITVDATVSFNSQFFEVDYILAGRSIQLVVDPKANRVIDVESLDGKPIGSVVRSSKTLWRLHSSSTPCTNNTFI
jgi:hypothetical protein